MKPFGLLWREFRRALPPTLFFLIAFHLSLLIRYLDEESLGVTTSRSVSATVSALVLGKLYLLLDGGRLANRFARRPLIIATLWKTLLYGVLASLALIAEELLPHLFRGASFTQACVEFTAGLVWPRFWSNHLLMIVMVLLFSAASELIQAVGRQRVMRLFFGRGPYFRRRCLRPR